MIPLNLPLFEALLIYASSIIIVICASSNEFVVVECLRDLNRLVLDECGNIEISNGTESATCCSIAKTLDCASPVIESKCGPVGVKIFHTVLLENTKNPKVTRERVCDAYKYPSYECGWKIGKFVIASAVALLCLVIAIVYIIKRMKIRKSANKMQKSQTSKTNGSTTHVKKELTTMANDGEV